MKSFAISALILVPGLVFAQGGQHQHENPIFGDECVAMVPPGIDLETCEATPAPDQSGIVVYFCESDVTIVCPPEE